MWRCVRFPFAPGPQEKVVNSITELYTFMDTSNSTLDLKVMGEGVEEEPEYHPDQDPEEAGECRAMWDCGVTLALPFYLAPVLCITTQPSRLMLTVSTRRLPP